MSNLLEDLQKQLHLAEKDVSSSRSDYIKKKKEFIDIENKIINASEDILKIKEKILLFKNRQDFVSATDDLRDADIVRFTKVLPDVLKKIENEQPIQKVDIFSDR
jgi:predicted  nucleic acid-binding Zn-ribbon protein